MSLKPLADQIIKTYSLAKEPALHILYTARKRCASQQGGSKFNSVFAGRPPSVVRQDIYNFMRRFAASSCSENHLLYGVLWKALPNVFSNGTKIV